MKKNSILLFIFFIFFISSKGQNLQEKLDSFAGKFISTLKSSEKIQPYLITDKTIFKSGETVWFRAFLLNSLTQTIVTSSKYLLVDLVNEQDSVLTTLVLDAVHHQLKGQFVLPNNMSTGYYWIRAYNKQIIEEDVNNCFIKPIYVLNSNRKAADKMTDSKFNQHNNTDIPSLKFYPEGGNIITGANSSVAFTIQNPDQIPLITEGYIKDSKDSIVAHFSSNKFGIGKFTFFPSSYRKYNAVINWNGKELHYPLPSFNFFAGQLAVEKHDDGKVNLRVLLEDSLYKKDVVTYVIGIAKDNLYYVAIGHGQYQLEVSEQKFPSGISTFYLFDKDFKMLSQRSIYIKENNLFVSTSVGRTDNEKRDKFTLSFSIKDSLNHPIPSLITVAAIDSSFLQKTDESMVYDIIDSHSINNISLASNESLSKSDIDLLMLLKKNMFSVTNVIKTNSIVNNYDNLFIINGNVLDENNNPAVNKVISLFSNSGNAIYLTDTTDHKGRFKFIVPDYLDSTQFAIEAKNLDNNISKGHIIVDPISFPHFSTPIFLKHYFSKDPVIDVFYKNHYFDSSVTKTKKLSSVFITKKQMNYDESKRISNSSTIISGQQLDERMRVGDIVLNTSGMLLLNGYLVIHGPTSMKPSDAGSEPLLIINGAQQSASGGSSGSAGSTVLSILNDLNPREIDFIEILKGGEAANFGVRGGNGVILVNMAHTRKENFTKGNNLQTFYARGITLPSDFPQINYSDKAIRSSEYFDNRSTIFWDGNIVTGKADTEKVTFYSNGIPTTFKFIINGVSVHGDIIYKTVTFQNKN